jgi:NADH:ubiquinone oxidoreductase subunit 6 (subunit J)
MMRKTAWIWFVGFAAWLADALLSLRMRNLMHARLALMVAIVFFTAGLFYYRRQT